MLFLSRRLVWVVLMCINFPVNTCFSCTTVNNTYIDQLKSVKLKFTKRQKTKKRDENILKVVYKRWMKTFNLCSRYTCMVQCTPWRSRSPKTSDPNFFCIKKLSNFFASVLLAGLLCCIAIHRIWPARLHRSELVCHADVSVRPRYPRARRQLQTAITNKR